MKRILLSTFCLAAGLRPFSQAPNNVILLLNIGQSNSVGRANLDPANEVTAPPGTFWYKQSTNTLEPLIDGVGEGVSHATDRSMNPMLGKRLKELTGHDVIIIPAAVGNTFIRYWLKPENSLYARAKQMWQEALAYCAANNITVAGKYAHWLQGENDAGSTETDGYYVMLNELTNDLISDVGVEKVFCTRIGYDPNYTDAPSSEKIMKAEKLLNFNNPNFIMDSYAPPTFTYANGKMSIDLSHHALAGLNQEAEDIAQAIQHYRATGQKIQLTETVASLQGVTNGYINLTQDWAFEFGTDVAESQDDVIMKRTARNWITPQPLSFTSDGAVVIEPYTGLATSRPFASNAFTLEMRLKMNNAEAWSAPLGDGKGGIQNKLIFYHNTNTSAFYVQLNTATGNYDWDLGNTVNMGSYHTLKFTQAAGVLKFYLDGVQVGSDKSSNGVLKLSCVGMGRDTHTFDASATIDFLRIKDNAGTALPLKFKSFKATNIK